MSGDTDLIKLYSTQILALAADIPHTARLTNPQSTVKKRSPLCGSNIVVDIETEDGHVSAFGQDVRACALGQAAASVVGSAILGRTLEEVKTAREQLLAMLKSDGPAPDAPFDGLKVLLPAKDFKNRHASIMLALDATIDAMSEANQCVTS